MRKRNKILIALVVTGILMTGVFVFGGISRPSSNKRAESGNGNSTQTFDSGGTTGNNEADGAMGGQATDEVAGDSGNKSKYEVEMNQEMAFDLTYIEDFISKGKQFILRRQIRMFSGDATSVTCLDYQISDPVDMRMEFFLLLNTEEVLRGYYSYYTGETSVERSSLTEADVYQMREEEIGELEEQRQESERIKEEQKRKETKKQETEQEQPDVQESEA